MRIAFTFSYIGTDFCGSQQQPGLRTVEGEFIRSCIELGLFDDWRDAGFRLSGRTDRGVHARTQICAFDTESPDRAVSALNSKLPGDIWCNGWTGVPPGYNPRYGAESRTYRYFFPDENLNRAAMEKAASYLPGRHDFSGFARTEGKNPVRNILSAAIAPDKDGLILEIRGESFLWNMVRCISHALWLVGSGSEEPEIVMSALRESGGRRFPAASPEGLILWDIETNLNFSPVGNKDKSTRHLKNFICTHHQLKKAGEFLL